MLRFGQEQVDAFVALSQDRNPLHVDAAYARRTPFGRPVVHGVAALLAVLRAWARGRRMALLRLRATFHRPVFIGIDYEVRCDEESFELLHGGEEVLSGELAARPLPDGAEDLPAQQVATLAWASYFVGMEVPGRQALFADLEVRFAEPTGDPFAPRDVQVEHDPAFRRVTIRAAGTGVESIRLTAFERPPPDDPDLDAVRAAVGTSDRWAGRTVLVTGASRGFGAVLARAFALHGAALVLGGRAESDELAAVGRDVASRGPAPRFFIGDAGDPERCAAMAAALGPLDVLVNNAIAPIPAGDFVDQPFADWAAFVADTLRLAAAPTQAFLPCLRRPGGLVVQISTAHASRPEPRLSSYVAAKAALEGLTRTLALEEPRLGFVIARPPRMLTDQTNAAVRLRATVSPLGPARALLERLAALPPSPNLHEVDL